MTPDAGTAMLGQYGILGVALLASIGIVRYLYNKLNEQFTERIKAAEERAVKAEQLALEAQTFIQDELLKLVTQATVAAARAVKQRSRP